MRTWIGARFCVGIGAVGAFLAVDVGAVAYANKWIGAGSALTPRTFLERFRRVFGVHPGFRRNHAKGVAVTGYFDSNGNGRELSKAAVFARGRTPVIGRFSLSGGHPGMADTPGAARSLALAFAFPEATQWRTAMLNTSCVPGQLTTGLL